MRLRLIAVGKKMPAWVDEACREYMRRLPREWHFELIEIAAGNRTRGAETARAVEEEGRRMLAQVTPQTQVIALDEGGESLSTARLSGRVGDWMRQGDDIAMLIGGADGLATACRDRADRAWSLSPLTLPHGMARIVVVEQLYRAWTVVSGHPYHRA